jgi:hypothetical protein
MQCGQRTWGIECRGIVGEDEPVHRELMLIRNAISKAEV